MTIHQLLNPTSGIFDYTQVLEFQQAMKDGDFKNQWSSDELVSFAKDKELEFFSGIRLELLKYQLCLSGYAGAVSDWKIN